MSKKTSKKRILFSLLLPALATAPHVSLGQEVNSFDPYAVSNAQGHYLMPPLTYKVAAPVIPATPAAPVALSAPIVQPQPTVVATAAPRPTPRAPVAVARPPISTHQAAVQPYDWSGGYAGVQFGGGLGTSRSNYISHNGIPYAHGGTTGDVGISSVLGGITVGYNEQFGHWVPGVESDFSVNSVQGKTNQPNPNFVYKTENPWLATFRARLGYAFNRVMPYITGGAAIGDEHVFAGPLSGGVGSGSDFTDTQFGWTAGAGIETALSSNWSIKAEYLYVQLNDAKGTSTNDEVTKNSFNENIAHIGLNYRFNQPHIAGEAEAGSSAESSGKQISLATQTGIELGGQLSSYRYQEHEVANSDFMREMGAKYGITATATKAFASHFFITGDSRFAFSENHYSSSGSGERGGIADYLGEIRLFAGKDFISQKMSISPYVGLGYRNLFNDLNGANTATIQSGTNTITETFHGYGRDSQYLYLPVGVTPRFRVSDNARISTNLEYDQLIEGWQESYLGDVSALAPYPNVSNNQYGGYGLRGSIMYERSSWSMGPFFDYWNINQSSETVGGNRFWFEPHNQTIEYGLQARYHF